jgi:hypothetical protein
MAWHKARSFVSRGSALLMVALLAAAMAQPAAADIVIGTANGVNNAFPFGTTNYVGEYQQLYASSDFAGPITITGLGFAAGTGAGTMRTFNATISFSTSSATLTTMSTNYAANRGADNTVVFNSVVNYTSAGNNTFDLNFVTTPFTYNPANGSLLLDVVIGSTNTGGGVFFNSTTDAVTTRAYNNAGNGFVVVEPDRGLVTLLRTTASAVPEPSVLALAGVAAAVFAAVGFARRRS